MEEKEEQWVGERHVERLSSVSLLFREKRKVFVDGASGGGGGGGDLAELVSGVVKKLLHVDFGAAAKHQKNGGGRKK